MARESIKSNAGHSFVELLIALSLFGVILGVAFTLHYYGVVSFARGEERLSKQQEARYAAKVLTDAIRYAGNIEVLPDLPVSKEPNSTYFALVDGIPVKIKDGKTEYVIAARSGNYSLEFAVEGKLVEIELKSSSEKNQFKIATSVYGLNFGDNYPLKSGSAIRLWD